LASAGDGAATTIGLARDEAPVKPSLWSRAKQVGAEMTADLENAGARAVNALASTGNAMIHHPGDVALVAAGALLAEAGVGGEGLGAGLDLTGAGAIVGGPLGVVSAAGIVAGATIAGGAAGNLIMHATSDDSVSPVSTDHAAGGSGTPSPAAPTVKERAAALGYTSRIPPQRAPFDSHGQAVFSDGDNYITRDVDAHNVSDGWKMFNRRGQRIGTYDENLNRVKD
jgi:Novel toxin 21